MSEYLPKEVREGLERARKLALHKRSRMRVRAGEETYRVLRSWPGGFSLDADTAPHIRGLVDMFDGSRHLYQALIVASAEDAGELQFEYKRNTAAVDRPPLDFVRDPDAPVGLISKD